MRLSLLPVLVAFAFCGFVSLKAENITPSDVSPAISTITRLAKEGNYETALKAIDTYISQKPENSNGYKLRAHIYFAQKKYNEALQDFTRVIELKPQSANAYVDRAGVFYAMENYEKALLDIDKALEIKPKSAFALVMKEGILDAKSPAKAPSYRVRNKGERLK